MCVPSLVTDLKKPLTKRIYGSSLVVQWLGVSALMLVGPGTIPGPGTKIPQAMPHSPQKQETQ